MDLITSNGKRAVSIGTSDILYSLYSTVWMLGSADFKRTIPQALAFFESGECPASDALATARQFNLIRDELSKFSPERAVYDMQNPQLKAPWEGNISPVITSCANLHTTADGKDLLAELVEIFTYAGIVGVNLCLS